MTNFNAVNAGVERNWPYFAIQLLSVRLVLSVSVCVCVCQTVNVNIEQLRPIVLPTCAAGLVVIATAL